MWKRKVNLTNKIIVLDDVISKNECNDVLDQYNPTHEWYGTYPMNVDKSDKKIMKYMNKIRKQVSKHINYNLEIEWCEIVKWPIGSSKQQHIDGTSDKTKFTSITYLNQSYIGGNTYIVDDMVFKPKIGRTVCFDGNFYEHGVNPVDWSDRYTIAIWYK
jgi:hypothetical protein